MAVVTLRGQLRALAGGRPDHEVPGATVGELLHALEAEQPALRGWILDERGLVRRHINVFVDGEMATLQTPVGPNATVHVIPAVSGG